MKKILLSGLLLGSITLSLFATEQTISQNEISNYNDIDNNFVKPSIIKFIEKEGYDYNEVIQDTENLRLDSSKIYIEGDKKAVLINVTNKTNKALNVEDEVGEGTAIPKILPPFSKGYLVITNGIENTVSKYDTLTYNDRLVRMITEKNLSSIRKYFYSDIQIYKLNGVDSEMIPARLWSKNNINRTKLFIVDRVDRVIDEDSNRFGLFVNGFIKVTNEFYIPVSYYFIINKGKIVKIFETDEYLRFHDFKKILYSLDD